MVCLCWFLVIFGSLAENYFIVSQSNVNDIMLVSSTVQYCTVQYSTVQSQPPPSPEWIPVERHRVKVDVRVVPLSQVGAAPVKTPYRQL